MRFVHLAFEVHEARALYHAFKIAEGLFKVCNKIGIPNFENIEPVLKSMQRSMDYMSGKIEKVEKQPQEAGKHV